MQKVTAICPQCGNAFGYYPSATRGKPKIHCSKKCWSEATWLTRDCPTCGVTFRCRQSEPRTYCSRKCAKRWEHQTDYIVFACDQCGKEVRRKLSDYQGRAQKVHVCSLKCWGEWLKIHTLPHIAARRTHVERTCEECGRIFLIPPHAMRRAGEGRFCNRVCSARWYGKRVRRVTPARPGSLNINWKGGHIKYYGPTWRSARRAARERDNYTCQRCGKTEGELRKELDVHHIKPFREFGLTRHQEANRPDNLISLCDLCHKAVEPRAQTKRREIN